MPKSSTVVLLSPWLIIAVHLATAYIFGHLIGKWAFVPMMLTCWVLWLFFILKFRGANAIKLWLQKTQKNWGWNVLAIVIGFIPLPVFLFHHEALSPYYIWLPWVIIAIVNPWIEEFYWRGLLLDYTKHWKIWVSVLYTSTLFAVNHIAFGINSVVNSGYEVIIATFVMGIVWAVVYKKTNSLRWAIASHFLVDAFNLSAASFLDAFEKGGW
jgi:membrane protease YdiL (CAAX protease family)